MWNKRGFVGKWFFGGGRQSLFEVQKSGSSQQVISGQPLTVR
jgi:hypothetical protein